MESYCGCLTLNEDNDPVVPMMDTDSTVEVCLDMPKYISEPYVYAQMAVLYPYELIIMSLIVIIIIIIIIIIIDHHHYH